MPPTITPHRVTVTGLGILSGATGDLDSFWSDLLDPNDRPTTTAMRCFDPRTEIDRRLRRHTDTFAQFAVGAARLAVRDSGLTDLGSDRTAVVVATGTATSSLVESNRYRNEGPVAVSPLTAVRSMPNGSSAAIAFDQGVTGHCVSVSSGCASGTHAVGEAFRLVRFGLADVVITGGAESFYAVGGEDEAAEAAASFRAGLANLKVLSEDATARPFSTERDGFIPADGAAILVLESAEHAAARGARVYATILGYGNTNDAADLLAPDASGVRRAILAALDEAGASPADVGFVNAHGTGTTANDLAEANAILEVFGHPGPIVDSTKGATGHAGSAAGAMEAAIVALAIDRAVIPPTAHVDAPDPALGIDVVVGSPRSWSPGLGMSTSLGLGGHNGALVLGPADHDVG